MPAVRKAVLDAIRGAMRDPVYGFNARFAEARAGYQLDSTEIDWTEAGGSVFYGEVASQAQTGLSGRLTLRIATGPSAWTNATKGMKWSGDVQGLMVFTVTYSHAEYEADGIEDYDIIERWKAAVEDCVVEVFARADIDWGDGVALARLPDCPDMPNAELFADGWEQVIPIAILFRVDAA